jgi:anti-anti-sigma regulatory factor
VIHESPLQKNEDNMADIKIEKKGDIHLLVISSGLTIEHAAELKETLMKSLENASHVMLNMDGVTETDLSCLQLLCSAHRTFVNAKKSVELAGTSDVLKQAALDAGYKRTFGCTQETEKTCFWMGI